MQILLSCAKDMTDRAPSTALRPTVPLFQDVAEQTAVHLMKYDADELAEMLHINPQLGALNKLRYTHFLSTAAAIPAIMAYNGIVFKRLNAMDMSDEQLLYADRHLWITSFLYGLLRPLNGIRSYRLEGSVELPEYGGQTMFDFWKPQLTQILIRSVLADDGILLNLASGEMKNLFDWRRVKKEVRIIEPAFKVHQDGRLKTIVVYTKMCRGAMARHALLQHAHDAETLKVFEYEGFVYDAQLSKGDKLTFILK